MAKPMRPIADRLWQRVEKTDSCWIWTGPLSSSGYGVIGRGGRHAGLLRTHRLAYELLVGQIPDGLQIDHLCMNKVCCNPDHLEAVTQAENLRRYGEAKTECRHGHPLAPRTPGKRRPRCQTCAHIYYVSRKQASA